MLRTGGAERESRERELAATRVVQGVVDLAMDLVRAKRAALVHCLPKEVRLVISRALDQQALDTVRGMWPDAPRSTLTGSPFFGVDVGRAFMVLPCLAPAIMGLLYVETTGPMPRVPAGHLGTFSALLGNALSDLFGPGGRELEGVEPGTVSDAERANLAVLLERNEWNVSRVARVLGVSRMTVYNRMARLRIPRERMKKG